MRIPNLWLHRLIVSAKQYTERFRSAEATQGNAPVRRSIKNTVSPYDNRAKKVLKGLVKFSTLAGTKRPYTVRPYTRQTITPLHEEQRTALYQTPADLQVTPRPTLCFQFIQGWWQTNFSTAPCYPFFCVSISTNCCFSRSNSAITASFDFAFAAEDTGLISSTVASTIADLFRESATRLAISFSP